MRWTAVPRSYREGAWALGATHWQTIWRVTLPAARSGVLTAVMLGVGRAIGETMTVMMVTGNAPVLAITPGSLFSPVRTMTATIAAEMGEVANGSVHYHVLFFIGMVLVHDLAGGQCHRLHGGLPLAEARRKDPVLMNAPTPALNRHLSERLGFGFITLVAVADGHAHRGSGHLHSCHRARRPSPGNS